MTIAIMQPYLFPYIGYWQLINAVDTFVIYDNIQFSKHGWFHRNNILVNQKKTLFTIPIKQGSDYLDVRDRYLADNAEKQIKKIISQIENSYKKAPYFQVVFPIVQEIFLYHEKNLFEYVLNAVKNISHYLGITTPIIKSSSIQIDHTLKSQEKVISINQVLHATKYVNPIGGTSLYHPDEFRKAGIELKFLITDNINYPQFDNIFETNLSIIDVMMFNSPEKISKMLTQYELVEGSE